MGLAVVLPWVRDGTACSVTLVLFYIVHGESKVLFFIYMYISFRFPQIHTRQITSVYTFPKIDVPPDKSN